MSAKRKFYSRREFLRISAVTGVGLIAAQCAPQPTPEAPAEAPTKAPAAPTATPVPTVAEAPKEEQVLRILHPVFDMDWSNMRGGGNSVRWLSLWWASPMYFDKNGKMQPYVFNEWASNEDFTVWTFKIDPQAIFSDGSPITAEDVKGTWDLMAHPATMHQRIDLSMSGVVGFEDVANGNAQEMPGIVAKDPQTVEVTLIAPDPIFDQKVASHLICPTKISQTRGPDGEEVLEWWHPKNGVVCSGPFMPESMDLDKGQLVFVPNPNFFGPSPKLDKVTITSVEDSQTATTMFQNGEADAHSELLTPTMVDDLGADFASGPMLPKGHHFWIWGSHAPMEDSDVRKALIMAVNSEELYKVAFPKGPNEPATQILNAVPGVDPDYPAFPYDPEGAKAALAASSYGGAENLPKLMFVGISNPAHEAAAQYVAEQWRQVLGIEQVEMNAEIDQYSGPDQESIQIFRDDVGTRVPDAVSYLLGSIHSSSGNAQRKMGGYANAEVDKLLEDAATKSTDDPDRIGLAQQAQRLFRDDWMYIPYHYVTNSKWAMPWVKNFDKNPDWQVAAPWDVYIEK